VTRRLVTNYRVFIYAQGIVLPLVIPVRCDLKQISSRLGLIFVEDISVTRAEVWEHRRKIMTLNSADIATLMALAVEVSTDSTNATRH